MNSTHPWSNIPFSVIDCPKHKELALKMAHESLVLLQNNNNILPLNRQMKVAVIGPNANDSVMQWGNYNGFPSHTVTLLEGIRAKLPDAQIILRTCMRIYKRHHPAQPIQSVAASTEKPDSTPPTGITANIKARLPQPTVCGGTKSPQGPAGLAGQIDSSPNSARTERMHS